MAFTVEEISASHTEDIGREDLRCPSARAGLEYEENPSRRNFKRVSERPIPEFTASDEQLRLVVAQTAYSRFRSGPWERIPDDLTADPVGLVAIAGIRFESLKDKQPNFLTVLNTTRDYVSILSASAYLFWRAGLNCIEIADELQVRPVDIRAAVTRLRYNAMRLGFSIKRTKRFRERAVCPTGSLDWYARLALANARPEVIERRRVGMKTPAARAAQSARAKAMNLERFLKTVAWG